MKSKIEEKNKAIELRKQGLSYREILEQIPVAKSSLSLWLKSVKLAESQKQRLTEKKLASARKGALKRKEEDDKCLIFDCYTPFHSYFRLNKPIDYWHGDGIDTRWESVPQHILLRLLTEGKEDLI